MALPAPPTVSFRFNYDFEPKVLSYFLSKKSWLNFMVHYYTKMDMSSWIYSITAFNCTYIISSLISTSISVLWISHV